MTLFDDIDDAFEAEVARYQELIDSGLAWRLEGSVGREAHHLIQAGYCTLGPERVTDYWGNVVPSKHDVVPGTPGSVEYVEARR